MVQAKPTEEAVMETDPNTLSDAEVIAQVEQDVDDRQTANAVADAIARLPDSNDDAEVEAHPS